MYGGGSEESAPDGSFRIGGLAAKPHALVGGSELAGFAFRGGVMPGGEPILLELRPAGRIAVRVVDAAGQPVRDTYPHVEKIDGAHVVLPGRFPGPTDATGTCELAAPTGTVQVVVRDESRTGRGTASVSPGETVALDIVLRAPVQTPP
jgi:hypothetical protein